MKKKVDLFPKSLDRIPYFQRCFCFYITFWVFAVCLIPLLPLEQSNPRDFDHLNSEILRSEPHFTGDNHHSQKALNSSPSREKGFTLFQIFLFFSIYVVTLIARLFALDIPRANNAGLNPWLLILLFIPVIGLIMRVILFIAPPKEASEDGWT